MSTSVTKKLDIGIAYTPTDTEDIAHAYAQIFEESLPTYKFVDHEGHAVGAKTFIRQLLSCPTNRAHMLKDGDKTVGAIIFTVEFTHPLLLQKEAFVWEFFLLPEARNRYCGWKLWKSMEQAAKASNCVRLRGTSCNPKMIETCLRSKARIDGYILAKEL